MADAGTDFPPVARPAFFSSLASDFILDCQDNGKRLAMSTLGNAFSATIFRVNRCLERSFDG